MCARKAGCVFMEDKQVFCSKCIDQAVGTVSTETTYFSLYNEFSCPIEFLVIGLMVKEYTTENAFLTDYIVVEDLLKL